MGAGRATLAARHWRPIFALVLSPIPEGADAIELPNLGKIIYFREGAAWVAVWPDFRDRRTCPVGFGASPGEAVAELVTQQR